VNRFRVLLTGIILIWVLFSSVQAEAGENLIFINGQELVTQPTAFLENNRLLIPFRAIFEAVGARVYWDEQLRKITAIKNEITLEMTLGSRTAYINGQQIELDVFPQIVEGRSFVLLRFVGETLGYTVNYDQANRWVFINEQGVSFGPQEAKKQVALKNTVYGIKVGDSAVHVIGQLGQPARMDAIDLGFTWWVYNQDYANYVQIGIKDNKVVALFTNAASLQLNDLKIGSSLTEIKKQYSFDSALTFSLQGATFRINPVNDNRYLAIQGVTAYIFYMDIHQENTLTAIRMVDLETLVLFRLYPYSFSYMVEPWVAKFVTRGPIINQTNQAYALQIFDLTNAIRYRFNLPPLIWHQGLSQVTLGHSSDMEENNFFAHISPTTGSPFDRINSARIKYRTAGENIAMGQSDAGEAVIGWMNSLGHRTGILNHHFTHLGVGVIGTRETNRFYTQKFIGN